ncbi:FecR domain-containing protein [uncultured Parabacteroides sp.]|uniref:FecR family protein n=1 Tax=uncultured Parabacteroides sp. TaxID=512312 RepID=UPI002585A0D4|nr:FecR domain-containing protein [uncultured Parabacteroides sp.]
MKQKKEINELDLFRYINRELTGQEQVEVEEWINASEENRKIAEDYYELFLATTSLQFVKRSATQKALDKVNKRIKEKQFRKLYLFVQRVAIILLLPLLGLSGFLLLQPREEVPVFYLETRMTPGMIGSTILPDGTKVWLNSSSYLKYPNTFSGNTREVTLDGEAYFEVIGNAEKPFIVHSGNSSVNVLGTKFNMDAYSSNGFIATTLIEGSIEFCYPNENNLSHTIKIEPNEQVRYDKETMQTEVCEAYVPKDIAWKNGQIILKETPLSEILWILSKRFNVEFIIQNPAFYKYSFTGVFTNQQIERVLEHFKRSSGIRYKMDYQLDQDGEIIKSRVELY